MIFTKIVRMLVAGAAVFAITCHAQETTPPQSTPAAPEAAEGKAGSATITKEQALRAIMQFRQDPLRAEEGGAGATILTFAEASTAVNVGVGPNVLPWMADEHSAPKYGTLLMLAYVAGDVRAQLEAHVRKDDRMAGALQVIDTYQLLKKSGADVQVPSIEQWIVLQKQGKLRQWLEGK